MAKKILKIIEITESSQQSSVFLLLKSKLQGGGVTVPQREPFQNKSEK